MTIKYPNNPQPLTFQTPLGNWTLRLRSQMPALVAPGIAMHGGAIILPIMDFAYFFVDGDPDMAGTRCIRINHWSNIDATAALVANGIPVAFNHRGNEEWDAIIAALAQVEGVVIEA